MLYVARGNIVPRFGWIVYKRTLHAARVDPVNDVAIVVLTNGNDSPALLAHYPGLVLVDFSLLSGFFGRELRPRDLPDWGIGKRGQHAITFLRLNRRTVQHFA
jgi:hypothetical protein